MLEGSIPVAIVFRIYYKAVLSAFATKVKLHNKKGETLLLQTDLRRSNAVVSRSIQWKDITLPDEWVLEEATKPERLSLPPPNHHLKSVSQNIHGHVTLSFHRNPTHTNIDNSNTSTIDLGRVSQFNGPSKSSRYSSSDIPSTSLREVDFSSPIPKSLYARRTR